MMCGDMLAALAGENDQQVRVFRNMSGGISFANTDDVLIEPGVDTRVDLITDLAKALSDDVLDELEGYVGSLNDLTFQLLSSL